MKLSVFGWSWLHVRFERTPDQTQCSVCRLRHRELLDAAHIVSDRMGGLMHVTNGLSMCKIHHAAVDANLLGIRCCPSPGLEPRGRVRGGMRKAADGRIDSDCLVAMDSKGVLVIVNVERPARSAVLCHPG